MWFTLHIQHASSDSLLNYDLSSNIWVSKLNFYSSIVELTGTDNSFFANSLKIGKSYWI